MEGKAANLPAPRGLQGAMTTETTTRPDIQIVGKARDVLQGALSRAAGAPYVRIHVGRG